MNSWTVKQLNETDDIIFAMCILAERKQTVNPYSPLWKKLTQVHKTLDELRGGCPSSMEAIRERIFIEVKQSGLIEDIITEVRNYEENDRKLLQGYSGGYIIENLITEIAERFDAKEDSGIDYWTNNENAVEYVLENHVRKDKVI